MPTLGSPGDEWGGGSSERLFTPLHNLVVLSVKQTAILLQPKSLPSTCPAIIFRQSVSAGTDAGRGSLEKTGNSATLYVSNV